MRFLKFITSHSGFSHLTSQTAFLGSWQDVWHLGGSQTGSQIAIMINKSYNFAFYGMSISTWAFRIVTLPSALRVALILK